MTVAELKKLIKDVPEDFLVMTDNGNEALLHTSRVVTDAKIKPGNWYYYENYSEDAEDAIIIR